VPELIERCVALLKARGVELSPGLTLEELAEVERRFGFEFGPDHRDFLLAAVPLGRGWVDWRRDPDAEIRQWLERPVDGALFDVGHNAFWAASWGPRPGSEEEALALARRELESWPKLVPIYGHRFMPAGPISHGAPVFSVSQTDVIYYGSNLLDYFHREFAGRTLSESDPVAVDVPPWSLLAMGYADADL
jgi:hypothetical protein